MWDTNWYRNKYGNQASDIKYAHKQHSAALRKSTPCGDGLHDIMKEVQYLWLIAVELSSDVKSDRMSTTLLDSRERHRAERFLRPDDRKSFVAAHTLKRLVLSAVTGQDICDLEFVTDKYGKPHLASNVDVHFNLSHTSGMVVMACSSSWRTGVDVECLGRIAIDQAMMELVLTDSELDIVERAIDQQRAFLQFWTIKEAVMKAEGKGMSMHMTDIRVANGIAATAASFWQLRQYLPSSRHVLTLAWEMPDNNSRTEYPVPCQILEECDLWQWAESGRSPASIDILLNIHKSVI